MAVINLTSEEFANRIEEMLDLASKGNVTPYSVTVKGFASPDPEKSCARRLVRFFQPVPLTVLRIPL